jgi:hypothetical protein
VLGGTRLPRSVLLLGLIAAGADVACAEKLDRSACKELESALAHVVATARANLPRERLQQIRQLIEFEEQLEFRCDRSHSGVAAVSPKERPLSPEPPARKPEVGGSAAADAARTSEQPLMPQPKKADGAAGVTTTDDATRAIEEPDAAAGEEPDTVAAEEPDTAAAEEPAAEEQAAAAQPTVAGETEAAETEPGKIAKDDAGQLKERAEVVNDDAKRDARTAGVNKVAGGAKKTAASQQPNAVARPSPSRPTAKNAYVSPSEVNPFFVTGTPR